MRPGAVLDALLYRRAAAERHDRAPPGPVGTRWLDVEAGRLRLFDSGGAGPVIVFAPDGPCVIEHFQPLIERLAPSMRVICFDLPGFGYSYPPARYGHSLEEGAQAVLAVLEALDLRHVTLALSCVNGFYGMAAAARAPERIAHLVLSQTPSLRAMAAWTQRIVLKPIRVPVLGQLLNFSTRRKVAAGWYKVALGSRDRRPAFQQPADEALQHGACYCFAGVVQGMSAAPDRPPELAGLHVPTTLVWGARDRSHQPTDPNSIRELLPQARIEVFEHCGHFPELEDPERYAALIAALHRP